jgi:hypothetical protein
LIDQVNKLTINWTSLHPNHHKPFLCYIFVHKKQSLFQFIKLVLRHFIIYYFNFYLYHLIIFRAFHPCSELLRLRFWVPAKSLRSIGFPSSAPRCCKRDITSSRTTGSSRHRPR